MGVAKVNYNNETLIDLTADTVTADTLLAGETAHDAEGNAVVGLFIKPKIKLSQTVEITENGSHTILPDEGYAGVSLVTANVNVPATPKTASGSTSASLTNGANTLTLGTVDFTPIAGGWFFSSTAGVGSVTSVRTPQGSNHGSSSLKANSYRRSTELSGNTIVGKISVNTSNSIEGTVSWWAVGS